MGTTPTPRPKHRRREGALDARALEQVIERSLPALGICRALQVLNAMHGGTLHQHLPDHEVNDKPEDTAHVVTVEAGSRLARIVGTGELGVNSLHHQGIDRLGEGLRATAHSPEGLVEAVELESNEHLVAVQWHPGSSPTARNSSRSSRISSLARALTLASHTGRARGPENPPHRSMWHRCRAVNRRVHRRGMERGREGRQLLRGQAGHPTSSPSEPELRSRVMSDVVTYEFEGDVAVVRIDDGKANALSPDVVAALDEAVGLAETEARALMLIGRPGRFSAGFDLPAHMQASVESAQSLVAAGARLAMRLYGLGIPTVAAARVTPSPWGRCSSWPVTPGWARRASSIGLNEVAIGLGLPVFGVELARDRLDPRRFTEATVQAQLYDPDGAAEVGYFDRVVMAGALEADARAVSSRLAELRSGAYLHTKVRARQGTIDHVLATLDADVAAVRVRAGRPDLNFRQGTHSAHHVARVSAVSTGPRALRGRRRSGRRGRPGPSRSPRATRAPRSPPGPEGPGTGRSRRTPGGGARRRLACPGSGRPRRARSRGRWRSDRPRGDRRGTPGRADGNTCGAT